MSKENINLFVRIRPFLNKESQIEFVKKIDSTKIEVNKDFQSNEINFDNVQGPNESNKDIFNKMIPKLRKMTDGECNATLFAQGQTGAGKTYTIAHSGLDSGLMQRSIKYIYNQIDQNKHNTDFEVVSTFYEIQNDKIYDLMSNSTSPVSDNIKELPNGEVIVEGVQDYILDTYDTAHQMLHKGLKMRQTGKTDSNDVSSRSHCILNIMLMQRSKCSDVEHITMTKLRIVDLAGSEKFDKSFVDSKQPTNKKRLNELISINKSLTALGHCIMSISEGHSHVPQRNSKITRILKDSILGNSSILMVINLSPSVNNSNESISSLQFAERIKKVKLEVNIKENKSQVNPKISALQKELEAEKIRRAQLEQQINHLNLDCNNNNNDQIMQVNSELNLYKNKNKELEQSLEQMIMQSCKNTTDKNFMIDLDFIDNPVIKEKFKQMSEERDRSPNSTSRLIFSNSFNQKDDQVPESIKKPTIHRYYSPEKINKILNESNSDEVNTISNNMPDETNIEHQLKSQYNLTLESNGYQNLDHEIEQQHSNVIEKDIQHNTEDIDVTSSSESNKCNQLSKDLKDDLLKKQPKEQYLNRIESSSTKGSSNSCLIKNDSIKDFLLSHNSSFLNNSNSNYNINSSREKEYSDNNNIISHSSSQKVYIESLNEIQYKIHNEIKSIKSIINSKNEPLIPQKGKSSSSDASNLNFARDLSQSPVNRNDSCIIDDALLILSSKIEEQRSRSKQRSDVVEGLEEIESKMQAEMTLRREKDSDDKHLGDSSNLLNL